MMFFALSAYLFGMKWVKGGCVAFGTRDFLKKRCVRIYLPLWIILPIVIITEWLLGSNLNTETVLLNLLGLGWVDHIYNGRTFVVYHLDDVLVCCVCRFFSY